MAPEAVIEAPKTIREGRCAKHDGRVFFETYFPPMSGYPESARWSGQCDLCGAEQRLELQARGILEKRKAEKLKRIQERHKPDEQRIEAATDAEIERRAQEIVDEMESYREQFAAEIRQRLWQETEQEVEAEMLAEIVEQLRKGVQANGEK